MNHSRQARFEINRCLQKPAAFAVIFFFAATGLLLGALGGAWLAVQLTPASPAWNQMAFIISFVSSTGLLTAGSVQLARATVFVRAERQPEFRRCLAWALVIGMAFVCVQTYGLQSLIIRQTDNIAAELMHAAFAFILLHAIHVVVALLFVVFIYLRALADRYDHEYSWGVAFCGWFWHGLGIIWIAIMAVFTVAGTAGMVH